MVDIGDDKVEAIEHKCDAIGTHKFALRNVGRDQSEQAERYEHGSGEETMDGRDLPAIRGMWAKRERQEADCVYANQKAPGKLFDVRVDHVDYGQRSDSQVANQKSQRTPRAEADVAANCQREITCVSIKQPVATDYD